MELLADPARALCHLAASEMNFATFIGKWTEAFMHNSPRPFPRSQASWELDMCGPRVSMHNPAGFPGHGNWFEISFGVWGNRTAGGAFLYKAVA